jgi:predicted nucleotidyltransferase
MPLSDLSHLTNDEKTAIQRLTQVVRWYVPADTHDIYLFGSRALGTSTPRSDYDIAIRGDTSIPWSARLHILSVWEGMPYRADLVDLVDTDPQFIQAISQSMVKLDM